MVQMAWSIQHCSAGDGDADVHVWVWKIPFSVYDRISDGGAECVCREKKGGCVKREAVFSGGSA